jgi:hypothetical protein
MVDTTYKFNVSLERLVTNATKPSRFANAGLRVRLDEQVTAG